MTTLRAACDDGHAVVVVPSSLGAPCDACGAPLRAADAPVGEAPWARVTVGRAWRVVGA